MSLSDEIDLDEIEAASCLLDSQEDIAVLGRPLLECAIVRFHQQRKYVLDAVRLLLDLDGHDDEDMGTPTASEVIQIYVDGQFFSPGATGCKSMISRCMAVMASIRVWLQKLSDKVAAAQTLGLAGPGPISEEMETINFSRVSLLQQHETLAIILCRCIERRKVEKSDLTSFIEMLRKVDRYDMLLGEFHKHLDLPMPC